MPGATMKGQSVLEYDVDSTTEWGNGDTSAPTLTKNEQAQRDENQ